jgi:N-acetylglutamate synthase-like GNAT family acetyltransferase
MKPGIRKFTQEDTPAFNCFCAHLPADDYLPKVWPRWLAGVGDVNLVLENGGQIVGCVHGEMLTPGAGWAQGLRVVPGLRRKGFGVVLLSAVLNELGASGAKAVHATIDVRNAASLSLVAGLGWIEAARVCRRMGQGRPFPAARLIPAERSNFQRIKEEQLLPANHFKLSLFGRAYFPMSEEFLAGCLAGERLLADPQRRGFAVVEKSGGSIPDTLWATFLAGTAGAMKALFEGLLDEAWLNHRDLVIDSPDEPFIQKTLEALDMAAVATNPKFVVVCYSFP